MAISFPCKKTILQKTTNKQPSEDMYSWDGAIAFKNINNNKNKNYNNDYNDNCNLITINVIQLCRDSD